MLAGVGDIIQELRLLMLTWIWFCLKSIVNCSNAMLVEWRFLSSKFVDEEGGGKGFH